METVLAALDGLHVRDVFLTRCSSGELTQAAFALSAWERDKGEAHARRDDEEVAKLDLSDGYRCGQRELRRELPAYSRRMHRHIFLPEVLIDPPPNGAAQTPLRPRATYLMAGAAYQKTLEKNQYPQHGVRVAERMAHRTKLETALLHHCATHSHRHALALGYALNAFDQHVERWSAMLVSGNTRIQKMRPAARRSLVAEINTQIKGYLHAQGIVGDLCLKSAERLSYDDLRVSGSAEMTDYLRVCFAFLDLREGIIFSKAPCYQYQTPPTHAHCARYRETLEMAEDIMLQVGGTEAIDAEDARRMVVHFTPRQLKKLDRLIRLRYSLYLHICADHHDAASTFARHRAACVTLVADMAALWDRCFGSQYDRQ